MFSFRVRRFFCKLRGDLFFFFPLLLLSSSPFSHPQTNLLLKLKQRSTTTMRQKITRDSGEKKSEQNGKTETSLKKENSLKTSASSSSFSNLSPSFFLFHGPNASGGGGTRSPREFRNETSTRYATPMTTEMTPVTLATVVEPSSFFEGGVGGVEGGVGVAPPSLLLLLLFFSGSAKVEMTRPGAGLLVVGV